MFAWPSHCDFKNTTRKKKSISIFLKDVIIHHRDHISGSTAVPSTPQVHMSAILLISIIVENQKIPFDVVSSGITSLPSFVKTGVLVQVKGGSNTYIQNRW